MHTIINFLNDKKTFRLFWLSFFVMSWVYLWLKAYYMPLFGDESASFFFYVHTGEWLPFLSHPDANNHFLNSFFSWLSYSLFGSEKLALRLPSLLFYPLYAYYVYKLGKYLHLPLLKWALVVALLMIHNFIEFFSLNRGYGMSMALLLAACFHLFIYLKSTKTKHLAASFLFQFLMLASNISLINIAIISGAIVLLKLILNEKSKSHLWKTLLLMATLWLLPVVFFSVISFQYKTIGLLYYGSGEGFWQVTVQSVIAMLFDRYHSIIAILFCIGFAVIIFIFLQQLLKDLSPRPLIKSSFLFTNYLIGSIVATILLQWIFQVNYPEDRVGMYLYPLFMMALLFSLQKAIIKNRKIAPATTLLLPLLLLPVQYIANLNLKYTRCYIEDYYPERFYEKIDTYRTSHYQPLVGAYRTRCFSWHYQNYQRGGKAGYLLWTNYPGTEADFQIGTYNGHPLWKNLYDSLDYENVNKRCLLKRKKVLDRRPLMPPIEIKTTIDNTGEFYGIWESPADSFIGKTFYLDFKFILQSDEKPFVSWVVATVFDSTYNALEYEYMGLDWCKSQFNNDTVHNGMVLTKISPQAKKITLYLWNIEKKAFSIREGKFKLFELVE